MFIARKVCGPGLSIGMAVMPSSDDKYVSHRTTGCLLANKAAPGILFPVFRTAWRENPIVRPERLGSVIRQREDLLPIVRLGTGNIFENWSCTFRTSHPHKVVECFAYMPTLSHARKQPLGTAHK
jgi:hypothetical protein